MARERRGRGHGEAVGVREPEGGRRREEGRGSQDVGDRDREAIGRRNPELLTRGLTATGEPRFFTEGNPCAMTAGIGVHDFQCWRPIVRRYGGRRDCSGCQEVWNQALQGCTLNQTQLAFLQVIHHRAGMRSSHRVMRGRPPGEPTRALASPLASRLARADSGVPARADPPPVVAGGRRRRV